MKNIVIFDLDGTLALIDHRRHFVECPREQQDWNAFYEACDKDEPNEPIIDLFRHFSDHIKDVNGRDVYDVKIFSGRSDIVRQKTTRWLSKQTLFKDSWLDEILRMRPEGDFTPDDELKKRWAEELGIDRIAMVFDDRDKVVKMWRSLGITCLQVANGNF